MNLDQMKGHQADVLQDLKTLELYLECPICLDILEDTHVVPACQHRFCGKCIQESLRKCNNECPTCRVHVSTKRSLRTDEVFESLVRSLSFILDSAETEGSDVVDFSVILESLKSLSWHFLCPVCNQTLKKAHISSECLHRFCQGCIEGLDSSNQCPCCKVSTTTSFKMDKQFAEIVLAVEKTITSFEKAGFGTKENVYADIVQSHNVDLSDLKKDDIVGDKNTVDGNDCARKSDVKDVKPSGKDIQIGDHTDSRIIKSKKPNDAVKENKIKKGKIKVIESKEETEAKYPRGTYFKDSKDRYGRVVGFDGQFYQIYYTKDGNCDVLREVDFAEVKIVQPHKRPSQNQHRAPKDNIPCCPNCKRLFSSDPRDKSSGSVPVQSQKCAHVICFDCVQSMRMSSCKNNKQLRSTVDCPICRKPQSFNGKDPTVCLAMCEVVSLHNKMKLRRNHELKPASRREQEKTNHKRQGSSSREDRKKRKKASKHKNTKQEDVKKSTSNMKCTTCAKEKRLDKFSSKQLKKGISGAHKVLCRRCEEKGKFQSRWGSGFEKYSTTISVAKKERSKPKFLTTVTPWKNGVALKLSNALPSNLTINGYSREPFSRLSNEDLEQEAAWTKSKLWSTGDEIQKFIHFLQQAKKSAYGTFLLPNGTDGFFVIPYDQPPPTDIFICKYILGLGVTGSVDVKEAPGSSTTDERQDSKSTLRKLLAAEYKTSQSLNEVPQGSVTAKKVSTGPEAQSVSHGPGDWFRERIVIKESDDEDSEKESSVCLEGVYL